MKDVIAMVLAGGRVDEMGVLTAHRSMAAIPFGGMYRIIDFALTNLSESGVRHVGILSQYRPSSLMDHVGIGRPWDYNGRTRDLAFLTPYEGHSAHDWYRGTADAVGQNVHFIERHRPRDVLIVSGDHVCRMHYGPLLDLHRRSGADLTMAFKRMKITGKSRFGMGVLGAGDRVVDYLEKPAVPPSDLVSLTVYLFRTEVLVRQVQINAQNGRTFHLYDEVIPALVRNAHVQAYVFDGGWEYARPLSAYHDVHMRLVSPGGIEVPMDSVLTNLHQACLADAPPAWMDHTARVARSRVAPGCRIRGEVQRSVLFPCVSVAHDAVVHDSVILGRTVIGRGARVSGAVMDKHVEIGEGAVIDGTDGLVALGEGCKILPGAVLPPSTVVEPGATFPAGEGA